MTVAPSRAPGRRRIRRRWIVLGAVLTVLVLLAAAVGIGAYAGLFDRALHPPVNPAPWRAGAMIHPARGTDPKVRSVLRAQQYETAWRSVVTGLGEQQVDQQYTFEPDQRRGERPEYHRKRSYLAGLSVYTTGDDRGPEYDIDVGEYGRAADARAALRDVRPDHLRRVSSPTIAGAGDVTVWRGGPDTTSTPCTPAPGKAGSATVDAVVDGTVTLSLTNSCFGSTGAGTAVDALLAVARKAVRAIRVVRRQPVPATWMPDTARVPIVSDGSWYQSELQVTGRRDGLDVDPLLDEPFAGSGVEKVFSAKDTVYEYADRAAAHAVLGRLAGMDVGSVYSSAPHRAGRGASDERWCAQGEHWQQGTTCWSRVGRFVVVDTYGHDGSTGSIDETQVKALRKVH